MGCITGRAGYGIVIVELRKNILLAPATAVYKDKGSKFLAYAWLVKSEAEIRDHLDQLKKEHFGARHWCYAWRLGENGESYRVNDDGEPGGSAGRPILAAIDNHGLSDILVVVVRYFGGTLLGVRGLINAYGGAATLALAAAQLAVMPIPRTLTANFAYDKQAEVQKVVNDLEIKPKAVIYQNDTVAMQFEADLEQIEALSERLTRIFGVEVSDATEEATEN